MDKKWYRNPAVIAAAVGAVIAGLFGLITTFGPALILEEKAVVVMPAEAFRLPGKQTFDGGQFSLELARSESAENNVRVKVNPPVGDVTTWQDVTVPGRLEYSFHDEIYFIHLLDLMEEGGDSFVKVEVARKRE
jgi:hypothetical protein